MVFNHTVCMCFICHLFHRPCIIQQQIWGIGFPDNEPTLFYVVHKYYAVMVICEELFLYPVETTIPHTPYKNY